MENNQLKESEESQEMGFPQATHCYTQYNYSARADSNQFYHLDFMAALQIFSEGFLGEDTCHELTKAFRKVEQIVLYNNIKNNIK